MGEFDKPTTQYTSFPAFDRVKLEIIDQFISVINEWKIAANSTANPNNLRRAAVNLGALYFWFHGFKDAKPDPRFERLRAKMVSFRKDQARGYGNELTYEELTEYLLAASEYLYELKITNILVKQFQDKDYLTRGTVNR